MSAARLAAEQAFASPPRDVAQAAEPLIIVRRARAPSRLPAFAGTDAAEGADGRVDDRKPRIFRIGNASDTRARESGDSPSAMNGLEQAVRDDSRGRVVSTSPRRRRATADQRPGPVRRVFQAPARQFEDLDAGATEPPSPQRGGGAEASAGMAALQSALDAIERARSFTMLDDRHDEAWERLLRVADGIGAQIRSAFAATVSAGAEPATALPFEAMARTRRPRRA